MPEKEIMFETFIAKTMLKTFLVKMIVSEPVRPIDCPVCAVNAPVRQTVAIAELIPAIKGAVTSVHESIMVVEPIEVVVSRREILMISKVIRSVRTKETR